MSSSRLAWKCLNLSCSGGLFEPETGAICPLCGEPMYRVNRHVPKRHNLVMRPVVPEKKRRVARLDDFVSAHKMVKKAWKHQKNNHLLEEYK